jgi:hypothetical protein
MSMHGEITGNVEAMGLPILQADSKKNGTPMPKGQSRWCMYAIPSNRETEPANAESTGPEGVERLDEMCARECSAASGKRFERSSITTSSPTLYRLEIPSRDPVENPREITRRGHCRMKIAGQSAWQTGNTSGRRPSDKRMPCHAASLGRAGM